MILICYVLFSFTYYPKFNLHYETTKFIINLNGYLVNKKASNKQNLIRYFTTAANSILSPLKARIPYAWESKITSSDFQFLYNHLVVVSVLKQKIFTSMANNYSTERKFIFKHDLDHICNIA